MLLRKIDIKDNPSDVLTNVIFGIKFQYCFETNSNSSNALSLENFELWLA